MRTSSCLWAVLTLLLAVVAAPAAPASQLNLRMELEVVAEQKHLTREQVERLLATTPPGPYFCPVGELWPAFMSRAPHSPETVGVLLSLYQTSKDRWKRYHLLSALSQERGPRLRSLWLKLLSDAATADRSLAQDIPWMAAMGLGNSGTDEDVLALTQRLGSQEWDLPVLLLLSRRPLVHARAAVLGRFRDRKANGGVRAEALNVLAKLGGSEWPEWLREAATDPDPTVQAAAKHLLSQR